MGTAYVFEGDNIMKKLKTVLTAAALAVAVTGCGSAASGDMVSELGLTAEVKDATSYTSEVNSAMYSLLDFEDTSEYENAVRGLIDAPEVLELKDENGKVVWSQEAYSFLDDYEKAPDTVNPSLWENTRNNHAYGLFEVKEGIYQVRGYDMANLTLIAGDTGWIVFDPLMSIECTQAAMQLVEKNLGERPVKAVIISHSHVDHYGGIKGLMNAEDVADSSLSIEQQAASGKIPVIAPEGFTEHAVAENIYAGKAMGRRANYQYGVLLEPGVTGKLAMGIGMGQSVGTISFIDPSYEITRTKEKFVIDGVELEFQMTPGTEAPAEMNTWLPQFNALWVAENCTGTLHNLYTLRGAAVRDGSAWSHYITEAISLYGDDVEVTFQSHNWPHWGNENVKEYMANTAAMYKYINDQTLTYSTQFKQLLCIFIVGESIVIRQLGIAQIDGRYLVIQLCQHLTRFYFIAYFYINSFNLFHTADFCNYIYGIFCRSQTAQCNYLIEILHLYRFCRYRHTRHNCFLLCIAGTASG